MTRIESLLCRASWVTTLAVLVATSPGAVRAQSCTFANITPSQEVRYVLDAATFDHISMVSRNEATSAIVYASEVWNAQASSRYFRFGTAYHSDPAPDPDCGSSEPISLVRAVNNGPGSGLLCNQSRAHIWEQCPDQGVNRAFTITVRSHWTPVENGPCEEVQWSAAPDLQSGESDLIGILVHEFGHALGLYHYPHSGDDAASVMQGHPLGSSDWRDLYEWDIRCTHEASGARNASAFRHIQNTNGTFQSSQLALDWNATSATPLMAAVGSKWKLANQWSTFTTCWDDQLGAGTDDVCWVPDDKVNPRDFPSPGGSLDHIVSVTHANYGGPPLMNTSARMAFEVGQRVSDAVLPLPELLHRRAGSRLLPA